MRLNYKGETHATTSILGMAIKSSLKTAMAISPKTRLKVEPQEQEIDEDDPCYYKYPGDGNVLNPTQEKNEFHDEMSPENNQNDKKRSVRHSCFYKRNG